MLKVSYIQKAVSRKNRSKALISWRTSKSHLWEALKAPIATQIFQVLYEATV
jgi:hypothetical protein